MAAASSPTTLRSLAERFAPAAHDAWLALVERTLKGAGLESLERRTIEGLSIRPLYEPAADAPLLQGASPGWEIRTLVAAPDPAAANAEALADLEGGADSILVRLAGRGRDGVLAASPAAFARIFESVLLDAAPVALDAGFAGVWAAGELAAAAKGAPAARLALHLDPLSAFAEAGRSPGPIEAHLAASAAAAMRLAEPYPRATFFLASGRAAHEAGAGEAAELAVALAAAIAYARALAAAGADPADAFGRIVLGLAADADLWLGVAKLRAARLLWSKVAGACGSAAPARIEARSSARMLTRADPWTNLIRLTAAGFAAAVGGADAVVLGGFTDALGPPSAFARRQGRNAQLILRDEAGLGRVADPAAGAGAAEAMTGALARLAWSKLQEIERAGGLGSALQAGLAARMAAVGREELARRIGAREMRILGVTDHPPAEARPIPLGAPAPEGHPAPEFHAEGPDSLCPALTQVRLETLA